MTPTWVKPMTANHMRLHGLRMADAGYSLVPIAAGQKWPGEYQDGKWWHLKCWEFLALTPAPLPLVENVWSNYPGCGVGIACGGHSRVSPGSRPTLLVYRVICTDQEALHWGEDDIGNLRVALNALVRVFRL